MRWPEFDGELSVGGEALHEAAEDFGHLVHHRPAAVLRADSLLDVLSNATEAGAPAMVEANQRLCERNRDLGGTLYPISAVGSLPLPSGREGRGPP